MNILSAMKPIRLFVLDVDGVLTDGTLLLLDNGEQVRAMSIKDGYAIQLAVKKNYRFLIISGSHSDAVKQRLSKLGVEDVHTRIDDKRALLKKYMRDKKIERSQVLYMGDDIPDLDVMDEAGICCAPADAVPEIRDRADYISPHNGGHGCVRDVVEKVLKLNGDWTHQPDALST